MIPDTLRLYLPIEGHLRYNIKQFPQNIICFCKIITLYGSYNWK